MKTKLNYLLILIILTILNSCERSLPKQDDFIGKWVSKDGAIIILNKDGTCILENVDYYKINSFLQNRDEKLYVKGKWDFIKDIESGIIDGLDYGINITYHLPQQNIKGEITFYISGKGLGANTPPWSLFIWDGDPDEMNKYEFDKYILPSKK